MLQNSTVLKHHTSPIESYISIQSVAQKEKNTQLGWIRIIIALFDVSDVLASNSAHLHFNLPEQTLPIPGSMPL